MQFKRLHVVVGDERDLVEWALCNKDTLAHHDLVATSTTGAVVETDVGIPVERLLSGPLGGDLQLGAKIAEGTMDMLVFFWDLWLAAPGAPLGAAPAQ